ncbi:hypothetical protein U0035_21515 [Niabella yanshanensis]|uniref:HEAT repeat domain-containing protein n=1 Tax=Niabella yanshanensis TaxID=577386 RepID=A0ABZ0W4R9_9BACT|nr:hypothetical protein [Niabella yanshanensis]WQD38253.1 hypothetical protein U0035_21515 [Niabella yanshanensis]
MKGDLLKKFVDENRDQFDDQSPDADILGKLQARLGIQAPVGAPKPAKLVRFRYWWAAAAVIAVVIGIGVLLQQDQRANRPIVRTGGNKTATPEVPPDSIKRSSSAVVAMEPTEAPEVAAVPQINRVTMPPPVNNLSAASITQPAPDHWQKDLKDESSSVRLAAVLASGKSMALSDDDMKSLYFTMNNDENSNVRLAALEVLKKREKAGNLILASVDKQDDPVVQMELLASLSPAQAAKVEQQLLEITQNPLTIDAVRNEAYAVLLRSNTNF